jgi:hypothetical protein
MFRKISVMFAFVALAFSLVASSAMAAVSFDPETGGFVGKGDVQLAFGWNNKDLQTKAKDVKFSYDSTTVYAVSCTWLTGPTLKPHTVSTTASAGVPAKVVYEARTQNQINGFELGKVAVATSGSGFTLGDSCAGLVADDGEEINKDATVTKIEVVSSGGGLHVEYGSEKVALPNTQ